MTLSIPARIENGQIIAEGPLPDAAEVERVEIVVRLAPRRFSEAEIEARKAAWERLRESFKGMQLPADYDYKADYYGYLEEKYR